MADKKMRKGQQIGIVATASAVQEVGFNEEEEKGPLVILNAGRAGSGKTNALETLITLPGRKILLDFDRNSNILFRRFREMEAAGKISSEQRQSFKRIRFGKDMQDPIVYPAATNYLDELRKTAKEDPVSVLIIDTLTSLGTAAQNDEMQANNKLGEIPNRDDYHIAMHAIKRLLFTACSFPSTHANILNCHIKRDKDGESGRYINEISTIGQASRDDIPNLFAEIYYSFVLPAEESKNNRPRFVWQTLQTTQQIARSALGLEDPCEQDYMIPLKIHHGEDLP